MGLIAVITTTAMIEEARAIAEAVVRRGLAACTQISSMESFYVWEGELQQEPEYRVILKTTEEMYQAVEKAIRELHSYELPAIYAVPLTKVFEPYGDWIKTNSQGSNQGEA